MIMESDIELVERVLSNNDQHSFTKLVMRHQLLVRSVLVRACRYDRHYVDDLLQETFLRAYLSLSSFRKESKLSTWLYTIAFNVAADKCRRKRVECHALDTIEEMAAYCQALNQSDLQGDLIKAMAEISEQQKKAVQLCLAEGYTHADAAQVLQLPLGTVKSHVARGRVRLQQILTHWQELA